MLLKFDAKIVRINNKQRLTKLSKPKAARLIIHKEPGNSKPKSNQIFVGLNREKELINKKATSTCFKTGVVKNNTKTPHKYHFF